MKCKELSGTMLLAFVLSCFSASHAIAQDVNLNEEDRNNRETISVKLYDNNEGNFLLDLPITFHMSQNNILFMFVGNNNGISGNNAIWMFDKTVALNEFLKSNKNITADKTFKKQLSRMESFFSQSENVEKYKYFDNGYELVQSSPKPVFFKVGDTTKPVVLKLRFYMSSEKSDRSKVLSSEAGIVKVTINITK